MRTMALPSAVLTLLIGTIACGADAPPATAPDAGLKITAQKHPEDKAAITAANGETVITITSASGIGDLTLERTGDAWPAKIRVILQYADGKPYTKLEGFTTLFGVGDGNRQIEVQAAVDAGTAIITTPMSAGVRKTLRVSWVDFYR